VAPPSPIKPRGWARHSRKGYAVELAFIAMALAGSGAANIINAAASPKTTAAGDAKFANASPARYFSVT
jgi:hypothetical protein